MARVLSWEQIGAMVKDVVRAGPSPAQTLVRTFGTDAGSIRVTFYRDNHAWCPYCQKVWMWLEERRIPYKVRKVTMFCYGDKEAWFKRLVPSGMLPALQIDSDLITESDVILAREADFIAVASEMDAALAKTDGAWFLDDFSAADVVFIPYVERMSASLYHYKGFTLRDPAARPHICRWLTALEGRPTYLGTQIMHGPWVGLPDTAASEPEGTRAEAATALLRHRHRLVASNPCRDVGADAVDAALRAAVSNMLSGDEGGKASVLPPPHTAAALRYVRDRVNVPRDMSIWAGRRLREALEATAALDGDDQGPSLATRHRRDQDPATFRACGPIAPL